MQILPVFREDRKQKSFTEANLKFPKNVMQCISFNDNFCAKEGWWRDLVRKQARQPLT